MRLKERFPALASKNFRIFLTAQSISLTGVWMQSVSQGWLIYDLTSSPASLALLAIVLSAPVFLLSIFTGLVADLVDRKKLLVVTQICASVPAFILWYLAVTGGITAGWITGMAVLTGVINAFEHPARHAVIAEVVSPDHLTSAVTLQPVAFNATRMIGSSTAGFLIVFAGAEICFLINFLSYILGAVLYSTVQKESKTERKQLCGSEKCLYEGIKFIIEKRDVAYIMIIVAAVSLFGIPFIPMLPLFADSVLHSGANGLGMLSGITGAGSLTAAVALAFVPQIVSKKMSIVMCTYFFTFSLFLFARSETLYQAMAALAAVGGGIVIIIALANCFIHQKCPDNLKGRVMAAYTFVLLGLAPVGHAMMGFYADRFGVVDAITFSSVICMTVVFPAGFKLIQHS